MKSPWKFLARFMPQPRPAETPESSIGNQPDIERPQDEAQQSTGLPLDVAVDPRGSEHDESRSAELKKSTASQNEQVISAPLAISVPDDVKAFHAPARRQTTRPTLRSRGPQAESEPDKKSPRTPLPKKLAREKRTHNDNIVQTVAGAKDNTQALSSREPFFDEVASLDEDLKHLRIQLARKLHLQNDQLKKMLKRFDIS
jgi:hypothetical protein